MSHQNEIIRYLAKVQTATLEQIYDNTNISFYYNPMKYMSEIMTRLVKKGLVLRVKKGTFQININYKKVGQTTINQERFI